MTSTPRLCQAAITKGTSSSATSPQPTASMGVMRIVGEVAAFDNRPHVVPLDEHRPHRMKHKRVIQEDASGVVASFDRRDSIPPAV
jgi:hypothetical protein